MSSTAHRPVSRQVAMLAETTPNTEITLIDDLDLAKLERLRHEGSVRNGRDRRRDLYRLLWTGRGRIGEA